MTDPIYQQKHPRGTLVAIYLNRFSSSTKSTAILTTLPTSAAMSVLSNRPLGDFPFQCAPLLTLCMLAALCTLLYTLCCCAAAPPAGGQGAGHGKGKEWHWEGRYFITIVRDAQEKQK